MFTYIIGYTLLAIVVLFVIFVQLVSRNIIFKHNTRVKAIFAHPLLNYSIRRIGSALISILLALTCTFFLIRFKVETDRLGFCQKVVSNAAKMDPAIVEYQCQSWLSKLGITQNWLGDLFNYYYNILPFPKTICVTEYFYDEGLQQFISTNVECRTVLMYLGRVYWLPGSGGKFVSDVIFEKMGPSFQIGIIAVLVEICLGYPAGILMAKHKDGVFDKIGKTYIISISAIPGVAYYYIWMSLFTVLLHLPNRYSPDNALSLLPPALTLGFTGMAGISLWVRRFMLDEFNSDYVKFARAKGLKENRIMYTHVLRNAIVPLVRSIPSAILGALLGSFYIEKIYAVDGVGGLLIKAMEKDFYVVQGIIVVSALISIVSYLLGDIVTAIADPRVSFTKE